MTNNVTNLDIDFHIYFLSKALLHYIDNTIDLSRKTLLSPKNVYDLEGIFSLTDIYATQVI